MFRRSHLVVLFALFLISGCQSYSSGLQQSVARADETAALAALHTIAVAQRTYSVTNGGEYASLKQLADGGFLDSRFAGEKPVKDYIVACKVAPAAYSCTADPDRSGEVAGRHLYIDSTGDGIHVNDTQAATAADKVIQ